jgi:hypothetical protein
VKKADLEVLTDIRIFSTPGHGNILRESIMMVERKIGLKILTNLYIFRLPKYEEVFFYIYAVSVYECAPHQCLNSWMDSVHIRYVRLIHHSPVNMNILALLMMAIFLRTAMMILIKFQ